MDKKSHWGIGIYRGLLWLILPFVFLRLLWRGHRSSGYYAGMSQRLAIYRDESFPTGAIIVHAVSVGETMAAAPLIEALIKQGHAIILTHMTPTGLDCGQRLFDQRVTHLYLPYDYPFAVERFLDVLKPSKVIIMETEWWPNLFHAIHRRGIPLYMVNTRLSEKSFKGYQQWRWFFKPVLDCVTHICAQGQSDADRLIALGVPSAHITVTGNLKCDADVPQSLKETAEVLRHMLGDRPAFAATSTHEGEEEIVLSAFQIILKKFPQAVLILVPRHPERFDTVYDLCMSEGFQVQRRSLGEGIGLQTQVYLGDTMGEVLAYYGAVFVAMIGGSLVPVGGHNVLEAAQMDCAMLTGPYLHNFKTVTDALRARGAMVVVETPEALAQAVLQLWSDQSLRMARISAATAYLQSEQGVLGRVLSAIE